MNKYSDKIFERQRLGLPPKLHMVTNLSHGILLKGSPYYLKFSTLLMFKELQISFRQTVAKIFKKI